MLNRDDFISMGRVKTLVRDQLGCQCPASVFDDVRVGLPSLFSTHDVAEGMELLVGGRLLVTVVPFASLRRSRTEVEAILERGRKVRDEQGFNRFRLVLDGVEEPDEAAALESLADGFGERMHVHALRRSRGDDRAAPDGL